MPKKTQKKMYSEDSILSNGVIAIVILIFAIIITLSFFEKAGVIGIILDQWILSFLFGYMRYIVPVALVVVAWYIVAGVSFSHKTRHTIGFFLFIIASSGLLHMQFTQNDMWMQALNGSGGGALGMVAWPLKNYLGTIASFVLLFGSILISLIFIFNTAIARIRDWTQTILSNIRAVGEDNEEYEEEDFVDYSANASS